MLLKNSFIAFDADCLQHHYCNRKIITPSGFQALIRLSGLLLRENESSVDFQKSLTTLLIMFTKH